MSLPEIPDRVSRGVDWLNDNAPAEWWDRVDISTLDLQSPWHCVLGQVFATFANETGRISGYHAVICDPGEIANDPLGFGFCPLWNENDARQLTREWVRTIEQIKIEVNA